MLHAVKSPYNLPKSLCLLLLVSCIICYRYYCFLEWIFYLNRGMSSWLKSQFCPSSEVHRRVNRTKMNWAKLPQGPLRPRRRETSRLWWAIVSQHETGWVMEVNQQSEKKSWRDWMIKDFMDPPRPFRDHAVSIENGLLRVKSLGSPCVTGLDQWKVRSSVLWV